MQPQDDMMEDIFQSMQNDRLIKICIGSEPNITTVFIAQSILCRTSRFFIGALTRGFAEDLAGELHLPEDDLEAWKILTVWMLKAELPIINWSNLENAVSAWSIADKYQISQMQDDIMFELIENVDFATDVADFEKWFAATRQDSIPRKMAAEDLVYKLKHGKAYYPKWTDIGVFQSNPSYAAHLLAAMVAFEVEPALAKKRIFRGNVDGDGNPLWLRYMTPGSKGPKKVEEWRWVVDKDSGDWRWLFRDVIDEDDFWPWCWSSLALVTSIREQVGVKM
ncbi:hypothetical protein CLAFUW4_04035 [Fulvia fulva]|uniref:BTB domain-containing protein n=1 Tax=Passalora fulva TaxID=5499 RepID=A0A9Q8LFW5_PASFU|nr:uncharacterized protein CLAFUR5_04000 [Fulvia fulva]KAK4626907.1 hypothetical protein CLAFUR4_04021 [Fulvia fulva]KAK4628555.1 hypothetical protein CLAFUR0_04022 [Fulvia fulva]UJO16702.1 hypothetical protein CLAFUR5_04000 [Fulvia fulva]WPV14279.1 hypothetical protein CLAFUW4_04035 [Fulvia fulva]WPV29209.1 hypothetical protein CLAFUW7_04024 [Fulvia fulva]